jgi:hypothetical protein
MNSVQTEETTAQTEIGMDPDLGKPAPVSPASEDLRP